uniref:THAP-type domain-containing protein n=1 Tax=Serinus canaria TaxID=9135 RepID=A0A8C9MS04_SERCA
LPRMGYCAALNCCNGTSGAYKNSSVSFYGFPLQNKALLRQWIQNMGRDMETLSKYHCLRNPPASWKNPPASWKNPPASWKNPPAS